MAKKPTILSEALACRLVSVTFFDKEEFMASTAGVERRVTEFAGVQITAYLADQETRRFESSIEARFQSLDGTVIKVSGNFEEVIAKVITKNDKGNSTLVLNAMNIRPYNGKTYGELANTSFKATTKAQHESLQYKAPVKSDPKATPASKIIYETNLPN